ncbi:circadian clock-controlled protein daywake [Bombyx mori]|uniref:Uncharacterized protein n=1 Tax=Bombyx mori TaxID=7091 RepID=A0A8R2CAG1_BOMMO|nr:circadian clock-controlled protein daywake-like [Bombyx mori]
MYRIFLILFICFLGTETFSVPSLSPCKKEDNVCLLKLSKAIYALAVVGNPELQIESSDPLQRDEIIGNLGVINYKLFNNTCLGYKRCEVLNSKYNFEKSHVEFELRCPEFYMDGLYEIDGTLLGVPIQGKGPYWIRCKDYLVNVDAETTRVVGEDNKMHLAIKNFKVKADLRGGMDLQLDNLFNGNKQLVDPVNNLIKLNWSPVAKILQEPTFNGNLKTLFKNFNKYLKLIPIENIILD